MSDLVTARQDALIADILKPRDPPSIQTQEDREVEARFLQQLNVLELAVLDRKNRLVGVLTADDAMDVIREEVTDDMFDKVGLLDISQRESDRSHRLIHGSFLHVLAVRVPFPLITLAGGMLAGAVIDAFSGIGSGRLVTARDWELFWASWAVPLPLSGTVCRSLGTPLRSRWRLR